jgi:dihydrodipicolinate synthase/N-acetylneuraminate lyase
LRNGDLGEAAQLHRQVLSLMALGSLSDTPLGAIKLAMNMLGVPMSPNVRGPALPASMEVSRKVEDVLREVGLMATQETG